MHYSCRAARDFVRARTRAGCCPDNERKGLVRARVRICVTVALFSAARQNSPPACPSPPRPFLASRSPFLVGALVIDVNRAALYAFREFFSRSAIRTFSKRDCQIRRPSHGESLDAPRVVIGHDRPIGAFVFCVASITGRVAQFLLVA